MVKYFSYLLSILMVTNTAIAQEKLASKSYTEGYFPVKEYTLSNGLKVFITVNKTSPRVQTMIAVKAGSKFDPPQTTGLAHYLEHMVFKGTQDFGTMNWEKEKPYLDRLSDLFEAHKNEPDEAKKTEIYREIDSVSYEASKWAIPNEYDKMTSSLGAQGTNAFTSNDMTVYINDIPSNAIHKWLRLEANRFKTLVLRLFHTELEAVYEEFNISQDRDSRWSYQSVLENLYPNHPYGTQTTIGLGAHLKNPSMVNIHNYFNTYYRPDNVAIILSGDVNPDEVVKEIQNTFGDWQRGKSIPEFVKQALPKMDKPVENTLKGPQSAHLFMGFRFDGAGSRESLMASLVDEILANGQAGLIDIDLVQKQKVLKAYSFLSEDKDYSTHFFYGEPRQGQSLVQVKDLLLGELEKVKKGAFDDWLIPAIIENRKLRLMKDAESNRSRASALMSAFVQDVPWDKRAAEIDELSKITKQELVDFANKYYTQSYAVCYKELGEPDRHKVEKPHITPVVMNKDTQSAFKTYFDRIGLDALSPKFLDFDKDIQHMELNKQVKFDYVKNELNKTFSLNYIFDMGSDNIKKLPLAVDYLKYIGTNKYTADELQKVFYRYGLSFNVDAQRDRVTITLSGLEGNLENGVKLFENILTDAKSDKEAYKDFVTGILQSRANAKLDKRQILHSAMASYAKYGAQNPFNNVVSTEELNTTSPDELVQIIKSLLTYKHKIFYYGQLGADAARNIVEKYHKVNAELKNYPAATQYAELDNKEPVVYFCNYDMKQAEVRMMAKDVQFDSALFVPRALYSEYYGGGLSSILFQEIRERMALAYSVYSFFEMPQYANRAHYIHGYVGTQSDKLKTALAEMNNLFNNIPNVPQQFDGSKENIIKTLESERVNGEDIYWQYDAAVKRGLHNDYRAAVYKGVQSSDFKTLENFFNQHIKNKKFAYCILGDKNSIDFKVLESLGKVKELSLKEVFGY